MDAIEAIKRRCSVREFTDEPMPKGAIERIIECGRLAPTARNVQPWEFIAVTGKKKLNAIADIADHGKFIRGAACAVLVFCKDTKYYLEDGCAATESMLIAASSLGIASCWVAGDKKPYCQKVAELLAVPADLKLVSIIALGHPIDRPVPLEKRLLKTVLHWEKF